MIAELKLRIMRCEYPFGAKELRPELVNQM